MTMEFSTRLASWGDAVIGAAEATLKQMQTVWPQKSDKELYSMLGVTPMIGKNMNGKVFEPKHAKQLVDWAKIKGVGHLAFWSIGRDKGCPDRWVGPDCSSIQQNDFEFTKIFAKFEDPNYHPSTHLFTHPTPHSTPRPTTKHITKEPTTQHLIHHSSHPTTTRHVTHSPIGTTRKTTQIIGQKDCKTAGMTYPHETDCNQYYVCVNGEPLIELCGTGTVWDNSKHLCNYPKDANRPECL